VRKGANEQTVVAGRQRVKGKSTKAIGSRRNVRRVGRVARNHRQNWVVRKCAARIGESSDYPAQSLSWRRSPRQTRYRTLRSNLGRTLPKQKIRVFRRLAVAGAKREKCPSQDKSFKCPGQWSSTAAAPCGEGRTRPQPALSRDPESAAAADRPSSAVAPRTYWRFR
jgi:hypothetical protein